MRRPLHFVHYTLVRIGAPWAEAGLVTFDFLALAWEVLLAIPHALRSPGVIMERFTSLVVRAWILVAVTSFATGAALALQFGEGMSRFGGKLYVPNIVAFAIVRALGPIFACLMVAARSGGGVAAEIGSMKVTQQIDALQALGGRSSEKLIAPIVIALAMGLPFLTFIADVAGITGGLLASTSSLSIAPALYLQKTFASVHSHDLIVSFFKTAFFGGSIGLIACFQGLRTSAGTAGIGLATTAAIVAANIFVLVGDLFITKTLWMFK